MTVFNDDNLSLNKENAAILLTLKANPLYINYKDLIFLIEQPEISLVLEAFELVEASALSEQIHPFEF